MASCFDDVSSDDSAPNNTIGKASMNIDTALSNNPAIRPQGTTVQGIAFYIIRFVILTV